MHLIFTLSLCLSIVLMTSIISLLSTVNVKVNVQETMPTRKLETGTEDRTCLCCPFIIWVEIPGYLPTSTRTKLLNIAQRTHGLETELEKGYSDGRGFLSTSEHTLEFAIRLVLSLTCFRSLNMLVATLIICKSTHASCLYKRCVGIQKVTRLFFRNLPISGGHETPEYRFTSKETEQIPVTPTNPKHIPRHFFELRERFTFFSIKQVLPGYELGRHHTANHPKGESSDGQEGEYRFEANRIKSFRNWPSASPASPLKLARAGLYYTGKGEEVVCFSCGGHLKQWQKGDDPQDKHRRSFPSCRQANGDDPRNVPLYERSFDETLVDGMTDPFPNLAREQRSRENAGSSSSSYYGRLASALSASGFGSQSPSGRATRLYDVEPREIKARMDTELVQLVLGLGFERLSVQNAVEQRLRTTGDDFHSAESLVEAVLNITESRRQRVSRPEVPVTSPPRDLPRQQSQMPHASPEVKASDRTGEPSGKKAMSPSSVPLDPDDASKILKEENLRLKEQRRCKICMDEEANIVFLPCGHLVSCAQCAPALRTCPICRSCIRGTVRTYN